MVSARQSAPLATSELRDELVRAVMPEVQVLMQHLVANAVDRALSPIVQRQQELESELVDLQRSLSALKSSGAVRLPSAPEASPLVRPTLQEPKPQAAPTEPLAPSYQVGVAPPLAPRMDRAPTIALVPAAPRVTSAAAAQFDIPSELNGSRRKRLVLWAFALAAVALLALMIGLSVASNLGPRM